MREHKCQFKQKCHPQRERYYKFFKLRWRAFLKKQGRGYNKLVNREVKYKKNYCC